MSGGSFDYSYRPVQDFAEILQNKLDMAGKDDGEGFVNPVFSELATKNLRGIVKTAELAAALMKEAEWLYSGDIGEEMFLDRIQKIAAPVSSGPISELQIALVSDMLVSYEPDFLKEHVRIEPKLPDAFFVFFEDVTQEDMKDLFQE